MSSFQTVQDGRFYVHILPTNQFKTRYLSIKLARPITRDEVTGTALLPFLWMEGTQQHRDAKSLIRKTEDMYGTSLRTGIGKRGDTHVVELHATFPNQQVVGDTGDLADDVLNLVLQVLTQPATKDGGFLEEHVAREKNLHSHRIESLYDDKIAYAMERCLAEVAKDSPVGLPRLGYTEDLASITTQNLYRVHESLLAESEVHIYYIGQMDDAESQAANILQHVTSRLAQTRLGAPRVIAPLGRVEQKVRTITETQDLQQGKLNLGYRTGVSYASDEYPALLMANGILGGFPHSKLFLNVREKESLAYYASSRLDALTGIVAIQTGIDVKHYEKALEIISQEVEKLKQGEITDEEMEFTRRGLQNQYTQALDQPGAVADVHFSGRLVGIDRGVGDLIEKVSTVSQDDVTAAAAKLELDVVYFLRNQEDSDHA